MVQKSGVHQLRLGVNIPVFTGFQKHPRWWSPDFFHLRQSQRMDLHHVNMPGIVLAWWKKHSWFVGSNDVRRLAEIDDFWMKSFKMREKRWHDCMLYTWYSCFLKLQRIWNSLVYFKVDWWIISRSLLPDWSQQLSPHHQIRYSYNWKNSIDSDLETLHARNLTNGYQNWWFGKCISFQIRLFSVPMLNFGRVHSLKLT